MNVLQCIMQIVYKICDLRINTQPNLTRKTHAEAPLRLDLTACRTSLR